MLAASIVLDGIHSIPLSRFVNCYQMDKCHSFGTITPLPRLAFPYPLISEIAP